MNLSSTILRCRVLDFTRTVPETTTSRVSRHARARELQSGAPNKGEIVQTIKARIDAAFG